MIQEGIVYAPFVPPLNQWTHIALTYDGTMAKLYANGVVVGTLPTSVTMNTAQDFFIGGRTNDPRGPHYFDFPGRVDEVEVFSRALTDAEIAAIFAAGSTGKCVPQPTPTPAPTATPTPSPTPTPTPSPTPTPTPSPTPTPTPTPTPSPTPTPTPTPAPQNGSFVIGDNDAVIGKHVTFWSAQWSKLNHPSSGGAPL